MPVHLFLLSLQLRCSGRWYLLYRHGGNQSLGVEILITMVVFGGCFTIDIYLEKDLLKQNYLEQMTVKEVAAAAIMAVAIFAFSNLSIFK
mgnify:CR=1 FL=1